MRELSPVRLTGGGVMLLLADAAGAEYVVPLDARLRETLGSSISTRGPAGAATPGAAGTRQEEPIMSIAMRPREIQDRVRAGESAEDLAAAAGAPVEKVLAYAGPVLAERAHVAQGALDASVRRSGEGGGSVRALGEAALARLREDGADPETLEWDAWRREDGRWTLEASYRSDGEARTARLVYDQRGRFVTPSDDEGRWIVGDTPLSRALPVHTGPAVEDTGVETPRLLRLAPPPQQAPDLGAAPAPDLAPQVDHDAGPPAAPEHDEAQLDLLFDSPHTDDEDAQDREDTAGLARRHPRKQRGRASVPSWDEIMFGGRD